MILTDYYKMEHLPDCKSRYRFDCVASTGSYPMLENIRNKVGRLFFYYSDVPDTFKAEAQRKADKVISKGTSISSIYVPDVTRSIGYGDIKGTLDAMLFVFNENYTSMEVFVARGQRNNRVALYQLLSDGELDAEILALKNRALLESELKLQV